MSHLVGVLGSVTPPGRLRRALEAALASAPAAQPGTTTALLDLAEVQLAFADGRPPAQIGGDTARVVAAIERADCLLFASPVYRGTYTGALKNLLDLLPVEALAGKACGILAMGASQHHYLGVDWHLRDVLAWFGAVPAPVGVYLTSADFVDGALAEVRRAELAELVAGVLRLGQALRGAGSAGPPPLAARRT
ncbi:MAG TPA: NADPH-dependent FMN reductase [Dehalococcoidia bacterium]|nr:NADPH-dependent FMN reductase [Dehalococcoidia bacterium]